MYRADAGEQNGPTITHVRGNDRQIELADPGAARMTSQTLFCSGDAGARKLTCGRSRFSSVRVEMGDRDDRFFTDHETPVTVDAGPGDDTFIGHDVQQNPFSFRFEAPSHVDFSGGAGRDTANFTGVFEERFPQPGVSVTKDGRPNDGRPNDRNNIRGDVEVLLGSPQADFLSGGPGNDEFVSSKGADTMHGLAGDDRFLMGAKKDGATRARGGGGRDTVTYAQRTQPVSVTADDDSLRDGEAGEADSVDGAEVIEGGSGRDTILTPRSTELSYRLIGNDGDDTLETAAGRDRLIGGRGRDSMSAGPDQDVLEARDGARDARVDCGSGGPDEALVDVREDGSSGCEIIRAPQLVGRLGLTAATRVRGDGTARVTLTWRHPRSWKRLRSIRLRVRGVGTITLRPRGGRAATSRRIGLAPGTRLVRRGRGAGARVQLRLGSTAARRLRAHITATDTAGRRQIETRSIAVRPVRR